MLLLASQFSLAQSTNLELSKKIVNLPVDVSTAKIKFTNLGYGNISFVKVIVPEMAATTILNHRNIGEDGPCLFTNGTFSVDDVLQDNPEIIDTDFTITLSRSTFIQGDVCKVTLHESVTADIRGFHFVHYLSTSMPDRIVEDCF